MELLNNLNWNPIFITLKLAFITTLVLFIISIPLAYFLAFSKYKLKVILKALIALPIVLPPTVIGFYFLIIFTPNYGIGKFLNETFNIQLIFTFTGLVLASIVYSLPFMVQPIQNGFESISNNLIEASYILGKSKTETLWKVLLPNCKHAIITACVLTFAHTLGEFGVVLMVGGSIPGKTQVMSSIIYEEVEALNYEVAHVYSAILLLFSFILLVFIYSTNKSISKLFLPK